MYGVVVPVKPPAFAKSRLAALGDSVRQELCAAFAVDTVAAIAECALVQRVLVVTDDVSLAAVLAELGVDVIPDGVSDDLNGSLALGAAELLRRSPGLRPAAVFADLPALRPAELAAALEDAAEDRMSFVADAAGTGTTTVAAPSLELFRPAFGPDSRQAHVRAGAFEISRDVPGLRQDVDTPQDLTKVLRLGAGPRTAFVATLHAAALG